MAHGFLNGARYDENVMNCANLIERSVTELTIPEGVTAIGQWAFAFCSSVTRITIPNSVTKIDAQSFNSIGTKFGIDQVVIPDSVTNLQANAFRYSGVRSFVISPNIKTLYTQAFDSCKQCTLYDFSRHESVPVLQETNVFGGINAEAKIIVPRALYREWIEATNWSQLEPYIYPHNSVTPPDVTVPDQISEGLEYQLSYNGQFYIVSSLGTCTDTVLVIPDEYNGLLVRGFVQEFCMGNTDLVEVRLPSRSGYNYYEFRECPNIEKLYFDSVSMNSFEFYGLTSLKYVKFTGYNNLGEGVFSSGENTIFDFSECTQVSHLDYEDVTGTFGTNPTIIVPKELYDEWVSDSNWTMFKEYIFAAI